MSQGSATPSGQGCPFARREPAGAVRSDQPLGSVTSAPGDLLKGDKTLRLSNCLSFHLNL